MAKIAVGLRQALALRAANGVPGKTNGTILARGEGWSVFDVVCTCGPSDRSFEEQHNQFSIAVVTAGTFQYRAQGGSRERPELMTPGSLLLGSAGQYFECRHEYGLGDRCLAFNYAPEYFARLAADAGIQSGRLEFGVLRLPPLRALSSLVARGCAGLTSPGSTSWDELGVGLACAVVRTARGTSAEGRNEPPGALARVTRIVREIEQRLDGELTLASLAREARLSPFHFLRTFGLITGLTPHQYILRTRLRHAAARLAAEPARVTDVALDCGFGDVSNFNRAFRAEFGVSPRAFRRTWARRLKDPHARPYN